MKATEYLYQIISSNNKIVSDSPITETREQARQIKRSLEKSSSGEKFKIVQYLKYQVVR